MISVLLMFPARAAGVAFPFFLKKRKQKKQPRAKTPTMSCRCHPACSWLTLLEFYALVDSTRRLSYNLMIGVY